MMTYYFEHTNVQYELHNFLETFLIRCSSRLRLCVKTGAAGSKKKVVSAIEALPPHTDNHRQTSICVCDQLVCMAISRRS